MLEIQQLEKPLLENKSINQVLQTGASGVLYKDAGARIGEFEVLTVDSSVSDEPSMLEYDTPSFFSGLINTKNVKGAKQRLKERGIKKKMKNGSTGKTPGRTARRSALQKCENWLESSN